MKCSNYKHLHGFKNLKTYKESLPQNLTAQEIDMAVGMLLSDVTIYKTKKSGAYLKIEQGFKQKDFIWYLHNIFAKWTVYKYPKEYFRTVNKEKTLWSYYFYTVSHPAFNILWHIFIKKNKKTYEKNTILNFLTTEGLKVWIIADGSFHKKKNFILLHTENFSKAEVFIICEELNLKFEIKTSVIHKKNI